MSPLLAPLVSGCAVARRVKRRGISEFIERVRVPTVAIVLWVSIARLAVGSVPDQLVRPAR